MISDELAPLDCPFCGLPPEVEPWHGGGKRKHAVSCPHDVCEASPMVTGHTKRIAILKWNRRELQQRRSDGYVLPREPTPEMLKIIERADSDYTNNNFRGCGSYSRSEFIYRAMLAAADESRGAL